MIVIESPTIDDPAGLGRHPEDPLGRVFGAILQKVFKLLAFDAVAFELGLEVFAARLEGVGDILEKQQREDDVLVLGGDRHGTASRGSFAPDLVLLLRIGPGQSGARPYHQQLVVAVLQRFDGRRCLIG